MKRSLRPATWSTICGRSTRSFFSTSIRRSACLLYLLRSPFTIDDLPVPRAPVRSTLFAGRPSRNWRVFCSTRSICFSMPRRSARRMRCTWRTGCRYPAAPRRLLARQRKAMLAVQSVGTLGRGRISASRCRISSRSLFTADASRPIFRIDFHVVEREVAGPHGGTRLPPVQEHANAELRLLHRRDSVCLAIGRIAGTRNRNPHGVDVELDLRGVEPGDTGIADRRQDAPEVRIGSEERRLYERRMRDGVPDLPALLDAAPAL